MHPLVLGGAGILRPAIETLAGGGLRVTVLAHGATDGRPQVIAAAVEGRDVPAINDAIAAPGPSELTQVYAPFAPATFRGRRETCFRPPHLRAHQQARHARRRLCRSRRCVGPGQGGQPHTAAHPRLNA
jgi:hypothetical protein